MLSHTFVDVFSIGFVGCRGGEDIWGFIWPNAMSGGQAVVLCPNGQGNNSHVLYIATAQYVVCKTAVSLCTYISSQDVDHISVRFTHLKRVTDRMGRVFPTKSYA